MPLPQSGPLNFILIRDEFTGNDPIIFTQYYRGGPLVPDTPVNAAIPTAGEIGVGDFYGAEGATVLIIGSNQNNVDLSSLFGSEWTANTSKIALIQPGVTVGSTGSGTPSLSVPSNLVGQLQIKNNGNIFAAGGPGGTANPQGQSGNPGTPGGTALSISAPVTIDNQGSIYGGGGGGGAGGSGNGGSRFVSRTCRRTASGGGCDSCSCPYPNVTSCNNTGVRCRGGRGRIRTTSCFQDFECGSPAPTSGGIGGAGGRGQGSNQTATNGSSGGGGGGGGAGSGGTGGPGSNFGLAGSPGNNSNNGGSGGAGGAAGNYVNGNSLVTWDNLGDVLGGAV